MSRSSRYSPEFRERAVHMLLEQQREYSTEWVAMGAIASKLGCTAENG
jgi:transposase-like protein